MSDSIEVAIQQAAASASATGPTTPIVIKEDRSIVVPTALQQVAVQCDNEANVLHFVCPRNWADIDLAAAVLYINVVKPDKSIVAFTCTNVVASEDTVTFDWLITGHITEVAGKLSFLVCARDPSDPGDGYRWHSNLCNSLFVAPGIVCTVPNILPDPPHIPLYGTDTTLTEPGVPADAKVVGDKFSKLSEEIGDLSDSSGSGMSSTKRSTLIAVVNAIGAFNVNNGQELIDAFMDAWAAKIPATGITLSAASLSFTSGTSQALTATVEPSDSTDTVVWSSSNPTVATVANGVVTPVANGYCVITATAGSVSAICTVNVAFTEEVVYYTITNNLTNCTSDNAAVSVVEGGSYTANLTAADGYTLDGASVSIVVNGVDVTDTAYSGGVVTIQSVTGDVVITAISVEVGATEEVTLLKSITGDGASYIDTGITMADLGADVQIELSAKLASNDDNPVFFGADMWNLYSNYGKVYADRGTMYCNLNNGTGKNYPTSQDSNGFWNSTAVPNLYSEQRWYKYVVSSNGTLAVIYMDEEMSVIPSSTNETMTAFNNYDADTIANSLPIIPIHIFASNVSDSAANAGKGYDTPGTFTLYYFRIKKHSTGEILHEYIPAKRGAEIGMYDNVTETFLPNAGDGTFNYEEVPA